MATYEDRRDQRFYEATLAALKDIEERAMHLPLEQHYAAAYGILRGYMEGLLVNFAGVFTASQVTEIRIVLDQLAKVAGENQQLDKATRAQLDHLAQILRETGTHPAGEQTPALHEAIERRLLAPHKVAMVLENGSLTLMAIDIGTQIVIDAAAASNLLDLLFAHREQIHRLSQGQVGTDAQKPPEKLDSGLGTR